MTEGMRIAPRYAPFGATRGEVLISFGLRLCGTGPYTLLPNMQCVGGRYPLGVRVVLGRSSQHPSHSLNMYFLEKDVIERLRRVLGDHLKERNASIAENEALGNLLRDSPHPL